MQGAGRVVFAGILLLTVGTINIIYGIGALDGARVFVNDTRYILTDLNTLGWVMIILGVLQLTGGFSLLAGNEYGRMIAIIAGTFGAIGAVLSIGAGYPWWSLCVFALCVYVVHGIVIYGARRERGGRARPRGTDRDARRPRGLTPSRPARPSAAPAVADTRLPERRGAQTSSAANVSQLAGSPDWRPRSNQRRRCSDEPCVNDSSLTARPALLCSRSSPTASAARNASSMSPDSSWPASKTPWAQTPA